jgi:hypothetical protein
MYKLLNNMGPKSLTNLFTYKGEMTSYKLRDISRSLCLPQPHANVKKVSCMTEHTFGILFQKKLEESKSLSSFRKKIATHID